MEQFEAFPILVLLGETNTGKNSIISVIRRCGYRTREPLVLRGVTLPILRDYLIETRGGVAILDEADSMMGNMDFEELIKCRSRKEQGQLTINRQREDGKSYKRETRNIYGALAVHRQTPFRSPSLVTRCITIHTKPNLDRLYSKANKKYAKMEIDIDLDEYELEGAPRIAENWCCVASASFKLEDFEFLAELSNRVIAESTELIEDAQAAEPTRLVLDGALALSFTKDNQWRASVKGRWRLSELSKWLIDEHAMPMNPWQIGRVLKSNGLGTAKSNGTYVANFTPQALLNALNGSQDELIPLLRSLAEKGSPKSTKSTKPPHASLWSEEN